MVTVALSLPASGVSKSPMTDVPSRVDGGGPPGGEGSSTMSTVTPGSKPSLVTLTESPGSGLVGSSVIRLTSL